MNKVVTYNVGIFADIFVLYSKVKY